MPNPPKNVNASEAQATIVFILGLLGLITCQVLGPIAWYMGNQYVEACREEGIEPQTFGVIGRVLGIVGTAFLIVGLVIALIYVLFLVAYVCCFGGFMFFAVILAAVGG